MLDSLILEGEFNIIKSILDQYNAKISDTYDELIGRYRIIYDVFCSRSKLPVDLQSYIALEKHEGIDSIADILISFLLIEELRLISDKVISSSTKELVKLALEHDLKNCLIGESDSKVELLIPNDKSEVVEKMLVQIAQIKKFRTIKNLAGERIKLYDEGFYYRLISSLIDAFDQSYENLNDACETEPFKYVEVNIDKVKLLDIDLQSFVWETMLALSVFNKEKHDKLYHDCPEVLKSTSKVEAAHLRSKIHYVRDQHVLDEVLSFCDETGDYNLLEEYVIYIGKEAGEKFIKDRTDLFGKDCFFIFYAQVMVGVISKKEGTQLLEKYRDIYEDDFVFHCLRIYNSDDETKESDFRWLKKNIERASINCIPFYFDLLYNENRFSELTQLAEIEQINYTRFELAKRMIFTKDSSCIEKGREILRSIISAGLVYDNIHYFYAVVCQELNLAEEAKQHYALEYSISKDVKALISLMYLRYSTNDIVDDCYLEACKHTVDSRTQNISGAFYLKLGNKSEAKKYFLRSLLIEPKRHSLSGFYNACEKDESLQAPLRVEKNTVVSLRKEESIEKIAIHDPVILDGITPQNVASCVHYPSTAPDISKLLFRSVGESIEWNGETYMVSAIESVDEVLCKALFDSILKDPTTRQFHFSSTERFIEDISSVLASTAKSQNHIIDDYDRMSPRPPLSVFAQLIGHNIMYTLFFLLNQDRIKIHNNINYSDIVDDNTCFILSLDSIVILFELGIDSTLINKKKVLCPVQVRQQLLSEISEENNKWQSQRNAGKLYYDGKPRLIDYTPSVRRGILEKMNSINDFVKTIPVAQEAYDYVPKQKEIKGVFLDMNSKCRSRMNCEIGSLGLQTYTTGSIIVTDDEFVSTIASLEGIPNIGLTGFVSMMGLDTNHLIDISKKLKAMSFQNYLPFALYRSMMENAFSQNDPYQALEKINKWIGSDNTSDVYTQHKDIIVTLCNRVHELDKELFDRNPFLTSTAMRIMVERNPKILEEVKELKNLQTTVEISEDGFRINVAWKGIE